jgi:uncharacterized protein YneF (UPF0154 family)
MTVWFVIGLLVPLSLVLATLTAAWLSSTQADKELRDEERAQSQTLRPKPPAVS